MIKQKIRKILVIVSIIIPALLTISCGAIEDIANDNLYPYKIANKTKVPDTAQSNYQDFNLNFNDGEQDLSIHGWYYYKSQTAPTIIYLHGNGVNIGGLYQGGILDEIKSMEVNVVVIDYPSYGKSTGFPTLRSLSASAGRTIVFAKNKFKKSKIIVWGRSLGTGAASQVINKYRSSISGFVLTSPWSTVEDLIEHHFSSLKDQVPEKWFAANNYNSIEAIKNTQIPGLILHGDKDNLIPYKLGQKLYKSIKNKRNVNFVTLDGFEHNDVFQNQTLWSDISRFVSSFR